jgi:putative protease
MFAMLSKIPELLTTAGTVEEAEALFSAGVDAVAVGDKCYALRPRGHFDLPMIRETVKLAHARQRKVYVLMNGLLHHDALDQLDEYVRELEQAGVDAIEFGDPAVLLAVRQAAPGMKLHWNTETTSTNYLTVQYWAKKGCKRAVLARELSLKEVLEIKRLCDVEIQIQVHGATCIFHSKRELVGNYLRYQHGEHPVYDLLDRTLFLKEQTRSGQRYPVFEDSHGTHVMSNEDICMIRHLDQIIKGGVDALYIDGFMKPAAYQVQIVRLYREAIDQLAAHPEMAPKEEWFRAIQAIQPKNRPLGTGFYFKEQIY